MEEMDCDYQSQPERYQRSLEDVRTMVKYAKLDEKNLTQITQAIYYPSENIIVDNLKMLELDNHILEQIKEGQTIIFKGGLKDKVVLCTDEKTYEIKEAEISNSLMLVKDLKFGQSTSKSPLKSPKTGNNTSLETSLNSSNDDDDELSHKRLLEHRNLLKIFHEYLECREIKPRYKKLGELLNYTQYLGPENEYAIDKKLKFTFEQLLDTIQCSRTEFMTGLEKYHAIEIDGCMRILDYEYEYRIVNLMIALIGENSWNLNEIDKNVTISSLDGIAPKEVVEGLFDLYTIMVENTEKFQYNEELVAKIIAKNILQPGLKFRIDEFLSTWQDALPEGMKAEEEYLNGLGIVDKDSPSPCVRSLFEDNLPIVLHERLRTLFKIKPRWTLNEMTPYIDYFTTPSINVNGILVKHARSIMVNDQRFFVAKHI